VVTPQCAHSKATTGFKAAVLGITAPEPTPGEQLAQNAKSIAVDPIPDRLALPSSQRRLDQRRGVRHARSAAAIGAP
jgi:hypothetical protein